jgi:hypothetical protein
LGSNEHSFVDETKSFSSDMGEDFGEGDISDEMQFVEQAQMDGVKKQIEEQHRVNETFRSMFTDFTIELEKFKTLVSPESEFTFEKYKQDWVDQSTFNQEINSKIDE